MSKNKKNIKVKDDSAINTPTETEEDAEKDKESGTLSDGVLDAFDEEALPADSLLLREEGVESDGYDDDEEDVGIDSGDYKPDDEW